MKSEVNNLENSNVQFNLNNDSLNLRIGQPEDSDEGDSVNLDSARDDPADLQRLQDVRAEVIDEQTSLNFLRRLKTSKVEDKYAKIDQKFAALNQKKSLLFEQQQHLYSDYELSQEEKQKMVTLASKIT